MSRTASFICAVIACVFGLLCFADSRADDAKYLVPTQPKRLALVVANSDYDPQEKLPGTTADGKALSDVLTKSDFKIFSAENVSRVRFFDVHLFPFLDEIEEGDFVVFYFSGHGFSYGGENYLVPLQFPAKVPAGKVFINSISVSSVMDLISARKPGFVFIVLDACRNFPNFITDAEPGDRVDKGFSDLRSLSGNVVIGFSSDLGKTSIGSSVAGRLSVYTSALVRHLAKDDIDLDTVQKEVHADVVIETREQQKPWSSEATSVEVWFRPSPDRARGEEEVWRGVLQGAEERGVARFLLRHSISRYAKAARQWQADHPPKPTDRRAGVSPSGPELARTSDPAHRSIRPRRLDGVSDAVSPTMRAADSGKLLLEIKVGGVPGGLKSLADASAVTAAIRTLGGIERVQRVTIATPRTKEKGKTDLLALRAAHLRYLLDQAGISSKRTSVVEEAADLTGDDLRVRFFGN